MEVSSVKFAQKNEKDYSEKAYNMFNSNQSKTKGYDENVSNQSLQLSQTMSQDEKLPKYNINERCFAGDGHGNLYLATIKDMKGCCDTNDASISTWSYLIHFNGWNARHDKWMTEKDIFPDNEEHQKAASRTKEEMKKTEQARKEKKQLQLAEKIKKRKATKSADENERKRGRPSKNETWSLQDYCELPLTLKIVVLEEQSVMYGHNSLGPTKVHILPATVTVSRILKQFVKTSTQSYVATNEQQSDQTKNIETFKAKYKLFVSKLSKIFDVTLPKFLLYGHEWEQYASLNRQGEQKAEPMSPNEIYSGEFLLRFIVRLPIILSSIENSFSDKSAQSIEGELNIFQKWLDSFKSDSEEFAILVRELIVFLQKHSDKIFKGKYREKMESKNNDGDITCKEKSKGK